MLAVVRPDQLAGGSVGGVSASSGEFEVCNALSSNGSERVNNLFSIPIKPSPEVNPYVLHL